MKTNVKYAKFLFLALYTKVRRNPVLTLAAFTIAAEAFTQQVNTGHFSLTAYSTYVLQAVMALVARSLVTPAKENAALKEQNIKLGNSMNILLGEKHG